MALVQQHSSLYLRLYQRLLLIDSHIMVFLLCWYDAILAPNPAQLRTAHQNSSHSLVKGQHVELQKFVDEFVVDDARSVTLKDSIDDQFVRRPLIYCRQKCYHDDVKVTIQMRVEAENSRRNQYGFSRLDCEPAMVEVGVFTALAPDAT